MDTPVVELKGVSFSYGGPKVLEKVNMKVEKGDFFALIGPNGAAKTTLMKVMLGLVVPNEGEVKLFGKNVKSFREWHKIAYVPQNGGQINLSFPATVREVVASGLFGKAGSMKGKSVVEAVRKAMATVGIEPLAARLIGELSGGERQKVFLARSLVGNPEVLFLDEPTTGIDAESQEEFYGLLEHFNKERGLTVVMITHDIGMACGMANKIGCVKSGKVDVHENTKDVTEDHIAEIMGYSMKNKRQTER
ncbi:zinc transport system ATP-binding protein [Caldanaerovirga acetigignens]|uniref:Zinc transport system ATP-binding protein n=1 Tax=Caldanaerovirga acetigignens TaxID=447595 RepID=A0A1M7GWB4_9FIRM|nr:metal ABC transporter ATP-binding protein [Caldanaerovirga acetigignens]SHM20672.1 zinc transport system ATP-binding protein [Caldanaerovirga acetigignens]